MKVKIGDKVYDSETEPIMVILSARDRLNIAKMDPRCTKYCASPADMSDMEVHRFMRTEALNV